MQAFGGEEAEEGRSGPELEEVSARRLFGDMDVGRYYADQEGVLQNFWFLFG